MKFSYSDLKNKFDFFLRQHLSFSRKNYTEKNELKDGILKDYSRAEFLIEKYNLDTLKSNSTRQNYLENLYTIDLLDKYLTPHTQGDSLKVLDIGCKNWYYAKSEYFFFKKYCKNLILNGIEIDSNRLYINLYSRAEVAKFHTKNLDGANYIQGDFLNHKEKYDYIIWFLPFVFEYPHMKWGLPLEYFRPEKMLQHAYDSLNDNGEILIINQGNAEFEYQKKLCKRLKIPFNPIGEIESEFLSSRYKKYLTLISKA